MKDPFYAQVIFTIERMIYAADEAARIEGFQLTDSQIRSVLIKAEKLARGESPKLIATSPRDALLAELAQTVSHPPEGMMEETDKPDGTTEMQPLEISEWVKAIEAAQGSIEIRRSQTTGSRDYLDYLKEFIGQILTQQKRSAQLSEG